MRDQKNRGVAKTPCETKKTMACMHGKHAWETTKTIGNLSCATKKTTANMHGKHAWETTKTIGNLSCATKKTMARMHGKHACLHGKPECNCLNLHIFLHRDGMCHAHACQEIRKMATWRCKLFPIQRKTTSNQVLELALSRGGVPNMK